MLKSLILFPLFLIQLASEGQENKLSQEFNYFLGIRLLHYHNCIECYFEPSEWDVPNKTLGVYSGFSLRRHKGFSLSVEYGQYNKMQYSNGVNTIDGESAIYNESLFYQRLRYANLSLGHTFGRSRLRFSAMAGLDYNFQNQYKIESKSSGYNYMNHPDEGKYPEIEPDGISRQAKNTRVITRGILPFIVATLRFELYENIFVGLGAEMSLLSRSDHDHVLDTKRNDSYRLFIAYRLASSKK